MVSHRSSLSLPRRTMRIQPVAGGDSVGESPDTYLIGQLDSVIRQVAAEKGAVVCHDVLLDLNTKTADYPYILVDQYGLLIIDVEVWPGASISGRSSSRRWTARIRGVGRQTLDNPYRGNSYRMDALIEALLACGRRLPPEYVTHRVVVAGADTSRLKLTDSDAARLLGPLDLEPDLRARYDFAVNLGALDKKDVEGIGSLLATIDQSDNAAVQHRHHSRRAPKILAPLPELGAEVSISKSAAGVGPVAPRLTGERYPSIAAPAKKSTPRSAWLGLVAVVLLAAWLFAFGGYETTSDLIAGMIRGARRSGPSAGTPAMPAPTSMGMHWNGEIQNAQSTLRDGSPEIYARLIDRDSPQVTQDGEFTVYTFHYIEPEDTGGFDPKWVALKFDASGNLVGVESP